MLRRVNSVLVSLLVSLLMHHVNIFFFAIRRTRSARMQRGNDTQSPVASVNSNDMGAVPITPPPSYSSFKFESPYRAKESTPSFKNSTDASEDEGSFVIGSRKASQQIGSTSETESLQESSNFTEQTVVKLQRQDINEEKTNGDKGKNI